MIAACPLCAEQPSTRIDLLIASLFGVATPEHPGEGVRGSEHEKLHHLHGGRCAQKRETDSESLSNLFLFFFEAVTDENIFIATPCGHTYCGNCLASPNADAAAADLDGVGLTLLACLSALLSPSSSASVVRFQAAVLSYTVAAAVYCCCLVMLALASKN